MNERYTHNRGAFRCLIVALLLGSGGLCSAAVNSEEKSASASPANFVSPAQANDGGPMFQSLLERAQSLKAYLFDSSLTTFKDGRTIKETGRVYFKRPNSLRFEVISAGNRSGAVVVRQPDGVVQAKAGGGLFGAIKLTLSPNSRMLKTANGFSILDTDLVTLIKGALKTPAKALATKTPTQYSSSRAFVLEQYDANGAVSQRIAVDPDQKLPIEWSLFRDGHILSVLRLSNLQVKPDMSDDVFVLEKKQDNDTKALESSTTADKYQNIAQLNLSNGCRPLDAATLQEAKELLLDIRKNANAIKDSCQGAPGETVTGADDKVEPSQQKACPKLQKALLRLAAAEADFDLLATMPKALDGLQYRKGTKGSGTDSPLSARWTKASAKVNNDMSDMSCTLRDDAGKLCGFAERASDIADVTTELEDIVKEAINEL